MARSRFLLHSLAACALIALSLTGCGAFDAARIAQTPVGAQTVADARNMLFIMKSGYGATERLATEYIKRPGCEKPAAPVLCSNRAVVVEMVRIRDATRIALNGAEPVVLAATESSTVLSQAMAAATSSYASFIKITDLHGGKS